MRFREYKPPEPLSEYIQFIWMMESESVDDVFAREQILPDGIVEVVTHYREPFVTYESGGASFIQPKSFAVSQMRKFIEIESRGAVGFVSVRFYPWGAYHFFTEPIKNFLDKTISTELLWKPHYDQLVTAVSTADSEVERFALVERFLLDRLHEHQRNFKHVDSAVKLIRESKGQLSIEELCETMGLSRKALERGFLGTVGTTPKIFSRVTRFLNICHHLDDYKHKTLTELTYECGYYDQAHLIKEFKEFSGFTPKEFFARNNVVFADL